MLVGLAKTLSFALLLRKGLHDANTGNGVGQHIGHFTPNAVNFFKACAQPIAHDMNHPADKGQWQKRNERKPGIQRKQNHRSHDNHHHIAGKVSQVQRQVHSNTVTPATHTREQVTRSLAPKILQGQAKQVLVGGGAQVCGNALRNQGQHIRFGPTQHPSE